VVAVWSIDEALVSSEGTLDKLWAS